jgi:hypothetical protein
MPPRQLISPHKRLTQNIYQLEKEAFGYFASKKLLCMSPAQ